MQHVAIEDVDPRPYDDEYQTDRRPLSGPLGTEHVAVTRYALQPGERFSGSYHAHGDQEEVFVVLAGEATFETEDGVVTVGPDEAIRFGPGEFQTGYNDTDAVLEALALGAPSGTEDVRFSRIAVAGDVDVSCRECGAEYLQLPAEDVDGLECPDCGLVQDPLA